MKTKPPIFIFTTILSNVLLFILLTILVGSLLSISFDSSFKLDFLSIFYRGVGFFYLSLILVILFDLVFIICFIKNKNSILDSKELRNIDIGKRANYKEIIDSKAEGIIIEAKKDKDNYSYRLTKRSVIMTTFGEQRIKDIYYIFPFIELYSQSFKRPSMIISDDEYKIYGLYAKTLSERSYNVHKLNIDDNTDIIDFDRPFVLFLSGETQNDNNIIKKIYTRKDINKENIYGLIDYKMVESIELYTLLKNKIKTVLIVNDKEKEKIDYRMNNALNKESIKLFLKIDESNEELDKANIKSGDSYYISGTSKPVKTEFIPIFGLNLNK